MVRMLAVEIAEEAGFSALEATDADEAIRDEPGRRRTA
jgi:hypothetical protein